MKKIALSLFTIVLAFQLIAQDRITGLTFATRSEVIAQNGMALYQPAAGHTSGA